MVEKHNIIHNRGVIMTEKRFKLTHLNHIDVKGIENLLNNLNDELEEVKKENEELKLEIQKLRKDEHIGWKSLPINKEL